MKSYGDLPGSPVLPVSVMVQGPAERVVRQSGSGLPLPPSGRSVRFVRADVEDGPAEAGGVAP